MLNSDGSAKTLDPKKSSIGQRRAPQPKKVRIYSWFHWCFFLLFHWFILNFQKGFGAQKVSTDFKEVERTVQEQEKLREQQAHLEVKNREEAEKQMEKQMYV